MLLRLQRTQHDATPQNKKKLKASYQHKKEAVAITTEKQNSYLLRHKTFMPDDGQLSRHM
jgi:hypothetical protein